MLAYFGALGETQVATFVSADVNILYIAKMDLFWGGGGMGTWQNYRVLTKLNLFTKHCPRK